MSCFLLSTTHSDFGIGKLLSRSDELVEIEYFDSPTCDDRKTVWVDKSDVRRVHLDPQTRAYFFDQNSGCWRIGRIDGHIDEDCFIALPNQVKIKLPEKDVLTRWNMPIDDPCEHLAYRLTETPYFHGARSDLLAALVKQRAACSGMSTLLSAPVSLERHQVEVVRRVLEDPVQRYLLADEVGLGKTIEAGLILRQYILDHPDKHDSVIVVPEALIDQWIVELRDRCQIGVEFGHQVDFISLEDLAGDPTLLDGIDAGFLIVDEAHQAVMGWDLEAGDPLRERYLALSRFSNPVHTPRLLLLSATPVRRNEDGFLALLHLLDPAVYDLGQKEAFRQKVDKRQDLADKFHAFTEDQMGLFLEGMADELSDMFPNDSRLLTLLVQLRPYLGFDVDDNSPERRAIIRAVRVHLSETYRLHRRLLRNRRSEELEGLLPGRDGIRTVEYEDDVYRLVEGHLESWRVSASAHVWGEEESSQSKCLNQMFGVLLELVLCDLNALKCFISMRLKLEVAQSGEWGPLLGLDEFKLLSITDTFPEERELLLGILEILNGYDDIHEPRLDALDDLVSEQLDDGKRVVVFVTSPSYADEVYAFLEDLHKEPVYRHHTSESDWEAFKGDQIPAVLVCDYKAEEGLNLQGGRTCIVHGDLPMLPNRIEQRIGRLDRFGVGFPVESLSLLPQECPYHAAWFSCLNDAYEVFSRSIAALQYVVGESVSKMSGLLLNEGVQCILDSSEELKGESGTLMNELRQIRAQDALDAIEVFSFEDGPDLTQQIEDFEDQNDFQRVLESWLVNRLQFIRVGDDGPRDSAVVRYYYVSSDSRKPSLVSTRDFVNWFESCIQKEAKHEKFHGPLTWPMSYNRETSRCRNVGLARIGNSLVDCLHRYLRWDDRGIAFAFWRHSESVPVGDVQTYFRFDFLIELGNEAGGELSKDSGSLGAVELKRRGDSILSPITRSIWLNEDFDVVTTEVLSELAPAYSSGRADKNINPKRWDVVQKQPFFNAEGWPELCRTACSHAKDVMIRELDLPQLIQASVDRLKKQTTIVQGQFQSRIDALRESAYTEAELTHAEAELMQEMQMRGALMSGVKQPNLRLDAAGVVFLAGYPFPGNEE
ncbi:protein DpdE [Coraliomargarita sp. SDUM461003]|uniref:Protein DpdE n=1 Tax=Thalassobacterium maritimum TaxID=3041265 RepID=A0ABU1AR84_9BACT|nr:protein DpdE [Coraliomargarita sp. SDUM461003]MDQ8206669.1 protein DpdE [Coraliomargarita sp. SDUM461003]